MSKKAKKKSKKFSNHLEGTATITRWEPSPEAEKYITDLRKPTPAFTEVLNEALTKEGMSDAFDKCNEPMKRFDTGAVRGTDCADVRYDLISPIALRRVAETYAEGSKKYGDSNWQKGIPTRDLLNHALKHIASWQTGDTSEDHLAHAAWNLFTMMHNEEKLPHLVSRPYAPGFDPNTDPTNK